MASITTGPSNPARLAERVDIEALEAEVESAIRDGDAGRMHVLGYGEFTLVLGWPTARPTVAVKRLPPFRDTGQFERYAAILHRYVLELERRGVPVLTTSLQKVATGGELHGYFIQELVPRQALLNRVLAGADRERARRLLGTVAGHVADAVDRFVGLDAQAGNWMVDGDEIATVDISTPLLRAQDGRNELDLSLFLSIYPPAARLPLKAIAPSVMRQYHDPRTVLVDVASNLIKERLDRWLPELLDAANARVFPPITEAEVRRYFARDKRFWLAMQRLRRIDRAWQRRVRRRPYPFLLPPPYAYGPPELPEEQS